MKATSILKNSLTKNRKIIILVFGVTLILFSMATYVRLRQYYTQEREQLAYFTESCVERLQTLELCTGEYAQAMQMLIVRQDGGTENFTAFAAQLMAEDTALTSIQLAPNGVLESSYPRGSSAAGLEAGKDLLSDAEWSAKARWVRDNDQMVLTGTSETSDAVLLYPVWFREHGSQRFWGYVVLEIDRDAMLQRNGLNQFAKENVAYELYETYYWNHGQEDLVMKSTQPLLTDPVERSGKSMDGVWRIRMTPADSWYSRPVIGIIFGLGILFSFLVAFLVVVFRELYKEKRAFEELSFRDTLTGAFNRRKFVAVLRKACRRPVPFVLCYIDFDRFKEINDIYGHNIGDLLLQAAAQRLRSCLREQDLFFRLGGDEFVALIREPGKQGVCAACIDKMHEAIRQPFKLDAVQLYIDISTGYVNYPVDTMDSEELIRMADRRMYEEKQRHSQASDEP